MDIEEGIEDETEEADWRQLTNEQFFKGFDDEDPNYDHLTTG